MIRPSYIAVWASLAGALFVFGNQSSVNRPDGRHIAPSEIDATITQLKGGAFASRRDRASETAAVPRKMRLNVIEKSRAATWL